MDVPIHLIFQTIVFLIVNILIKTKNTFEMNVTGTVEKLFQ